MDDLREREKRVAAEAATQLVCDGDRVGLGTGSTVAHVLPALARRRLTVRCIATSPQTEHAARDLGLIVDPFTGVHTIDIAIDGADQIAADGWLIKGGGGAHTREKIVAAAARRFVVIASSDKLVERLAPPVPIEVMAFGIDATLAQLGAVAIRNAPPSPDGGVIADYAGPVGDPEELATWLSAQPGVVEHGLFAPTLVTDVLVGRGDAVERIRP